jgi:hypothetical protein
VYTLRSGRSPKQESKEDEKDADVASLALERWRHLTLEADRSVLK